MKETPETLEPIGAIWGRLGPIGAYWVFCGSVSLLQLQTLIKKATNSSEATEKSSPNPWANWPVLLTLHQRFAHA